MSLSLIHPDELRNDEESHTNDSVEEPGSGPINTGCREPEPEPECYYCKNDIKKVENKNIFCSNTKIICNNCIPCSRFHENNIDYLRKTVKKKPIYDKYKDINLLNLLLTKNYSG